MVDDCGPNGWQCLSSWLTIVDGQEYECSLIRQNRCLINTNNKKGEHPKDIHLFTYGLIN